MRGNHFSSILGVSGFGESHGKVVGVLLEDIKPGIEFPLDLIQAELEKRRPGKDDFVSMRNEADKIEVLSGVLDGITTGMPICLIVRNKDHRPKDYEYLAGIFRPGHADWSWYKKFKIFDWRGGGRASGRETIARVAAGAIVQMLLKHVAIDVYPVQIGGVDARKAQSVKSVLQEAQNSGDTSGGIIEVKISNIEAGLGDPVFGKLDAKLAGALLSIGGIKGIEFGEGFKLAAGKASETNDQMDASGFLSNHQGGILGGVSSGEEIIFRLAVKPPSSISIPQKTVDIEGNEHIISRKGRYDTSIVKRIIPVVLAMTRLVLADCLSYQKLLTAKEKNLSDFREAIDKIDEDIIINLRKRKEIVSALAKWKKENEKAVFDAKREEQMLNDLVTKAKILNLDKTIIQTIWKVILEDSKKVQEEVLGK